MPLPRTSLARLRQTCGVDPWTRPCMSLVYGRPYSEKPSPHQASLHQPHRPQLQHQSPSPSEPYPPPPESPDPQDLPARDPQEPDHPPNSSSFSIFEQLFTPESQPPRNQRDSPRITQHNTPHSSQHTTQHNSQHNRQINHQRKHQPEQPSHHHPLHPPQHRQPQGDTWDPIASPQFVQVANNSFPYQAAASSERPPPTSTTTTNSSQQASLRSILAQNSITLSTAAPDPTPTWSHLTRRRPSPSPTQNVPPPRPSPPPLDLPVEPPAMVIFHHASQSLQASDFERLVPLGAHLRARHWSLLNVVQQRSSLTFTPTGTYYILFANQSHAQLYCDEVRRLHRLYLQATAPTRRQRQALPTGGGRGLENAVRSPSIEDPDTLRFAIASPSLTTLSMQIVSDRREMLRRFHPGYRTTLFPATTEYAAWNAEYDSQTLRKQVADDQQTQAFFHKGARYRERLERKRTRLQTRLYQAQLQQVDMAIARENRSPSFSAAALQEKEAEVSELTRKLAKMEKDLELVGEYWKQLHEQCTRELQRHHDYEQQQQRRQGESQRRHSLFPIVVAQFEGQTLSPETLGTLLEADGQRQNRWWTLDEDWGVRGIYASPYDAGLHTRAEAPQEVAPIMGDRALSEDPEDLDEELLEDDQTPNDTASLDNESNSTDSNGSNDEPSDPNDPAVKPQSLQLQGAPCLFLRFTDPHDAHRFYQLWHQRLLSFTHGSRPSLTRMLVSVIWS